MLKIICFATLFVSAIAIRANGQVGEREVFGSYFNCERMQKIRLQYEVNGDRIVSSSPVALVYVRDGDKTKIDFSVEGKSKGIQAFRRRVYVHGDQSIYCKFDHLGQPVVTLGTYRTPVDRSVWLNFAASIPLLTGMPYAIEGESMFDQITSGAVATNRKSENQFEFLDSRELAETRFTLEKRGGYWVLSELSILHAPEPIQKQNSETKIERWFDSYSDVEYQIVDGFPLLSRFVHETGRMTGLERRVSQHHLFTLKDWSFRPQEKDFLIEGLSTGTPIEVSDVPVPCHYEDGRVVLSNQVALDGSLRGAKYPFASSPYTLSVIGTISAILAFWFFRWRKSLPWNRELS